MTEITRDEVPPATVRAAAGGLELQLERREFRRSLFWPINTAVCGTPIR